MTRATLWIQMEAYTAGVRRFDFDQHLAPYNLSAYQQWQSLASCISKGCIERLSPLPSGNISITAEADPALLRPVTAAEQKLYTQLQEGRPQMGQSGAALCCLARCVILNDCKQGLNEAGVGFIQLWYTELDGDWHQAQLANSVFCPQRRSHTPCNRKRRQLFC